MTQFVRVRDKHLGYLYFPIYDTVIAPGIRKDGIWDKYEFDFISKMVKPGDTCINVGSNVGYFVCLMSKLVGKSGKVYSIEANPHFKKFIQVNVRNVAIQDNVEIIMSAAGNETGEIDLYINSGNAGDNRVYSPELVLNATPEEKMIVKDIIQVPIDTVDNLVSTRKVDFVLIDCQGFDHNVIRGMKDIIKNSKPKIVVEFEPNFTTGLGEGLEDILVEYQELGYRLYNLNKNDHEVQTPKEIIQFFKDSPQFQNTNIYMEPIDEK